MTSQDSITSKQCIKCDLLKPVTEFKAHSGGYKGHRRRCKACDADIRHRRRVDEVTAKLSKERRVRENPATWLAPGETLMAGGYDFSWCYVWFKDIPGWPGYCAGVDGSIWTRLRKGKPRGLGSIWRKMKAQFSRRNKRFSVSLFTLDGKRKVRNVHCLILEAFTGPCPLGLEGCHNNGIATDNRPSNLRWDTHAANMADMFAHGTILRGEKAPASKLTENDVRLIRIRLANGEYHRDIARSLGVSKSLISMIATKKIWSHVE